MFRSFARLLEIPPFSNPIVSSHLFEEAIDWEIRNHHLSNPHYRRFLEAEGWHLGDPADKLPPLPVGAFKFQPELTQIGGDAGSSVESSGTSGRTSRVWIDRETAGRQKASLRLILSDFFGAERRPTYVFDVHPRDAGKVGARQAAILGFTRMASSCEYLVQSEAASFTLKNDWAERLSSGPRVPSLAVGFTYVLFLLLKSLPDAGEEPLFPVGTKLIHIGGWKKLTEAKISRNEFAELVTRKLGIESSDIHDVYGFTELLGATFIECEAGWKHVPHWVHAFALSDKSLSPLENREQGLLAFVSPLAHSYTGLSIVTDDLGEVDNGKSICECGREGSRLRVVGRRAKAEIRGCGDILAQKLLTSPGNPPGETNRKVIFFGQSRSEVASLEAAVRDAREHQRDLARTRLSDTLAVIAALRKEWKRLGGSDSTGYAWRNGLGYLYEWSDPDHLREILDLNVPGGRTALDSWVDSGLSKIRAYPRGQVAQWASGNVPMLAMYPIIYSWLTGNSIVTRVSNKHADMLGSLLSPLSDWSKIDQAAHALAHSTVVCSFDRSDERAHTLMSSNADVIIAWGGEQAMRAISEYPRKTESVPMFFGPRTSFAVIFDSMLQDDSLRAAVARRLVSDATVFEQTACASPHSVFVVTSDSDIVEKFASALHFEFSKLAERGVLADMDSDLKLEIDLYRKRRQLDGQVLSIADRATVVVNPDSNELANPVFGQTLHLVAVDQIENLQNKVSDLVQSVGLLGTRSEVETAAETLGQLGVKRFPEVGKMTNFEDPWDGKSILSSLVRVATLGGPK